MGFWTDYCSISLDTALPQDHLFCDVLCVSFLSFRKFSSLRLTHFHQMERLNWVQLIRKKIKRRISEIEGDTQMIDNRTISEIEARIEGDPQMIENRRISEIEAGIEGDPQMIENRRISGIEARIEGDTQ